MSLADARLDAVLDEVTTVSGTAHQAMMGAVVFTAEGTPVYIAGLREWDDGRSGKSIEVTGVLRKKSLGPDPTVDEDGAVSHGIEGTQYVLEGATWDTSGDAASRPIMTNFFFVYDRSTRTYPLRYWVRPDGAYLEDAPAILEELDGTVDERIVESLLEPMRRRFPEPRYAVACMTASGWEAVEQNFPGLYDH